MSKTLKDIFDEFTPEQWIESLRGNYVYINFPNEFVVITEDRKFVISYAPKFAGSPKLDMEVFEKFSKKHLFGLFVSDEWRRISLTTRYSVDTEVFNLVNINKAIENKIQERKNYEESFIGAPSKY